MKIAIAVLLTIASCGYGQLPVPKGPFQVGRTVLCFNDDSRSSEGTGHNSKPRVVLVSLFYPAPAGTQAIGGPYIPELEKLRTSLTDQALRAELGMTYSEAAKLRIAVLDLAAGKDAKLRGKYPLLLFLPGLMHGTFKYSYQLLDLASHGYVVAAVNPPGEVSAFACLDGTVVPRDMSRWGEAQRKPGIEALAFQRERNAAWADDALFVMRQLLRPNRDKAVDSITKIIDRNRVGAFGHSMGGMAAVMMCQKSSEVKACVDQDGASITGPFTDDIAISQPFLWIQPTRETPKPPTPAELEQRQMTQEDYTRLTSRSGAKTFERVRSDGWWLTLIGPADHGSFDDSYLFRPDPPKEKPEETLAVITGATRAFFDQHVKQMRNAWLSYSGGKNKNIAVRRYRAGRLIG